MEKENQICKRPLSIHSISSRVWKREDNIYKMSVIQDILMMCFDEMEKALESGEKVGLSDIGSLNPQVHTPITYNVSNMNDEEGNKPYTTIRFTRGKVNKRKMNNKYLQNIKNGFPGLGDKCKCNKMQENILVEKGILKAEDNEV